MGKYPDQDSVTGPLDARSPPPAQDGLFTAPEPASPTRLLARTVEQEIIPRLMQAHLPPSSNVQPFVARGAVSACELGDFVQQVLHGSDAEMQAAIAKIQARGVSFTRLLMDLLAPAARQIGEQWCEDECNFNDVTVAIGRMQQVLRDHSASLPPTASQRSNGSARSILLAACPGEQHTFGLSMVAEFFHQAGWDVSTHFLSLEVSPAELAREHWFDVIGLSVGSAALLDAMSLCIKDIREASMNQAVPIIAGGPIFALQPELDTSLDVDAIVVDASTAPALAEHLVARVRIRA